MCIIEKSLFGIFYVIGGVNVLRVVLYLRYPALKITSQKDHETTYSIWDPWTGAGHEHCFESYVFPMEKM